tara:strand:+ start:8744 stop:9052 length:309 start_codon:yes stop_codon:yes gene_type:complete
MPFAIQMGVPASGQIQFKIDSLSLAAIASHIAHTDANSSRHQFLITSMFMSSFSILAIVKSAVACRHARQSITTLENFWFDAVSLLATTRLIGMVLASFVAG